MCILHQERGLGRAWGMQSTGSYRYQQSPSLFLPHVLPLPLLEFVQGSNKVAACQAAARPESQNSGLGMFCAPRVKIPRLSQVRDRHHRENGSNTLERPTVATVNIALSNPPCSHGFAGNKGEARNPLRGQEVTNSPIPLHRSQAPSPALFPPPAANLPTYSSSAATPRSPVLLKALLRRSYAKSQG